jgi:predicted O-methyltransferase YrrM
MFNAKAIVTSSFAGIRRRLAETKSRIIRRFDDIEDIVASSATIPGWIAGEGAKEVARASLRLREGATIVAIGVFMGRSTVLLAGPRRLRGSGKVHCVDAFDCSGDTFSAPYYEKELQATGIDSLEGIFRRNISRMKLDPWVKIHKGTLQEVAAYWTESIDLLLLDADHSPQGARQAYELWLPFLKTGGTIILRNTADRVYATGHDGNRRLAMEEVVPPNFSAIRQIGDTTFALRESRSVGASADP